MEPVGCEATRRRWREGAAYGALAGVFAWQFGLTGRFASSTPQVVLLATLAGLLIGWLGTSRYLLLADLAALLCYFAIGLTPLLDRPIAAWVRADAVRSRVDAIVVLASSVTSDSSLDVAGADRMLTGIALIRRGVAPRIVTTRVEHRFGARVIASDADQRWLLQLAGADSMWTSVTTVQSTRDEAIQLAAFLEPAGARTIAVVTSPMHTRRACATLERVGFRVICVAAREHLGTTWHPVTGSDRVAAFRAYLHERVAMLKYQWKGWVA
jgi:uncharacterized SAM-binding protein YcdF (DUF218 family)